jgi:hypothetical protein
MKVYSNLKLSKITVLLVGMICWAGEAFAVSQREMPCRESYSQVQSEGSQPTKLSLELCKNRCGDLPEALRINANLENAYQYCSSQLNAIADGGASAKASCSAVYKELIDCSSGDCKAEYDSCISTCKSVPDIIERGEYFKRCQANYNAKKSKQAAVPVEPAKVETASQEPVAPDDETSDAKDASDPVPEDPVTGQPNLEKLNSALQGIGSSPATQASPLESANIDPGAIDFTKGPNPRGGGYDNALSGIESSNSSSYAGTASGVDDQLLASEFVGNVPGNPNNNNGGAGAPMGANGSVGSMGNASSGSGANTSGNRRSGGYRQSPAGEYLGKNSPFSYYAPGGTAPPGKNTGVRGSAKRKLSSGPKYTKKENDGKDALHRLFGAGQALPGAGGKKGVGAYGPAGRTCLDTVFCSMETFFKKIERYPNSEINPSSY